MIGVVGRQLDLGRIGQVIGGDFIVGVFPCMAAVGFRKIDLGVEGLVTFQVIPFGGIKRFEFGINRTFISEIPIGFTGAFVELFQLFVVGELFEIGSGVSGGAQPIGDYSDTIG